ncbi:hypothetical protein ACW9UR_13980 [Halovulum sp. GXIMD14794]|jgi:hypothetical protein
MMKRNTARRPSYGTGFDDHRRGSDPMAFRRWWDASIRMMDVRG